MTETQREATPQSVVEFSNDELKRKEEEEKKRRKQRREDDIKSLDAKMSRIKAELKKNPSRPDKQILEDRLKELQGRRDHLQMLNDKNIFTHPGPPRRPYSDRTRYHGLW